ncbi:hypothetical protein [Bacteroides helcogenes]|uniref:Alkyl hydroperoxide reductase subunit C/ Thiol specific antioxidant domain-containing protein n=1 Tax=Bacteroides helcogenes (strain ATCC 35417 / DSM 20613 / JCM 6297 / CCUG 15421 / P 36-108) TaxID=693979 RepID=E6SUJ2_BACT6|nr:hypothetical protein [Bacteroides helcogenes]ADV43356.1 hypothetical protein Bache_1350 [Bacteroides helcogenes P 36-108]MDY5238124.1 hypothetical protein [Bacteroides helcogenes]
MRKKEYIIIFVLISVLMFCNVYTYLQCKKAHKIQTFLYRLNEESGRQIGYLNGMKECRITELFLNGKIIPTNMVVMDMEKHKLNLPDVIKNNMLILRYSEMHCNVCIDSIIARLNAYKDLIGLNNIILLTTSKSSNYIRQFKKMNKVSFEIYNMDRMADSIFVDIGMPYLFIYTSNDKRINNMFIPQKEDSKLTDEYLRSILIKYYTK